MDEVIVIVAIVIGFPVLGGSMIAITALLRGWALKSRELKVQEQRIQMEEKLRTDELNMKLLRMDDSVMSSTEIASLAEEVRQLRQEVTRLKEQSISH